LNVDFDKKILEGKAILDVERISSITELVSKGYSFFENKIFIYLFISLMIRFWIVVNLLYQVQCLMGLFWNIVLKLM